MMLHYQVRLVPIPYSQSQVPGLHTISNLDITLGVKGPWWNGSEFAMWGCMGGGSRITLDVWVGLKML